MSEEDRIHKAKLKKKMKKNKEMQGYRSRRKKKRRRKGGHHDLEDVGSEMSSEFSTIEKSSSTDGANLSGRGTPFLWEPVQLVPVTKARALEDFGLRHWRDAIGCRKFQPFVRVERVRQHECLLTFVECLDIYLFELVNE